MSQSVQSRRETLNFKHAKKIAGYNWPLYAASGVGILIAAAILLWAATPLWLRAAAAAGIVVAVWYSVASFVAFYLMFDRSPLLDGSWLHDEVAQAPKHWVQINAGLGETTIPMRSVFPESTAKLIDIFDSAAMTEPAITKARQQLAATNDAVSAKCDALPVDDAQTDLALVMLAAHEIRDRNEREGLFRELSRISSPSGKVILVEHLRDFAAAIAFGPGMFHFFPRSEWLGLANLVGLKLEREHAMTPWVRMLVFSKA